MRAHFLFLIFQFKNMKREGYINDKQIEKFEVIKGFSGKIHVIYNGEDSNILASAEECEEFKEFYLKNEERPEEDLGYKVAMMKSKPTNLTQEQKKIEERISLHDDKISQVTVPASRFLSQIYEGQDHFHHCQMCSVKDQIIQDKNKEITELQSRVSTIKSMLLEEEHQKQESNIQKDTLTRIVQNMRKALDNKTDEIVNLQAKLKALENQTLTNSLKPNNQEALFKKVVQKITIPQDSRGKSIFIVDSQSDTCFFDLTKNNREKVRSRITEVNQQDNSSLDEMLKSFDSLVQEQSESIGTFIKPYSQISIVFE